MRLPFKNGEMDLRPTKILCLLQNYREHAAEMSSKAPDEPLFFLKPPSAMLSPGGKVVLPKWSNDVHHEVELAVVMGDRTKDVTREKALESVFGYTIALDLTARDVQSEAKKGGRPWAIAKGFDTSMPVGPRVVPAGELDPHDLKISLKVNGKVRQSSSTSMMVHDVEKIIQFASSRMTLEQMDMILTGTPSGVGKLERGDVVEAEIEGIGVLKVDVSG
jgi:2-keto-4-pentenoate hydratase/2-oxohepta-3-ene-1,7-dioic acid hydratase in catechol pathway